jgi:UPF0755 protein
MRNYRGRRGDITFGERRPRRAFWGLVSGVVALGLLSALAVAAWLTYFAVFSTGTANEKRAFNVDQGQGVGQVAARLENLGLVSSASGFVLLARVLGRTGDIKAGSYEAEPQSTPLSLLEKLTKGEFAQGQIRFIEGWTFRQLRVAIEGHPALRHDTKGLDPRAILQRLEIEQQHPEGLFFPDTYHFAAGTSDLVILRQAYERQRAILDELWQSRSGGLPLRSPYEALILASIVEKETGHPEEREMVAAVFVNRLRKGMRLQADPTIIYGLGEAFDGNLRKRDLLTDQPYNSYTRYGLPPTPIALPGKAAIAATLNPAKTKALYFVARGDGSHRFSETLAEHNRAVNEFQRSRR